ncbi:MAG: acetylglutamate kinase [Blastocatellia bacterium]|nr:acetylglutamate kinase [Blastocatellia bacterium]
MTNIALLREALPYINQFKGKTFVIKFGGEIADDEARLDSFCEELALCAQVGIRMVVIHGGGKQANELSEQLGIEPRKINGRRITDEQTLDVVKMVFAGKINTEILGSLRKSGIHAVGLTGVDGQLLTAHKRPPQVLVDAATGEQKTVDFGFVGDILDVETKLIETLLAGDFVPVIASLAANDEGEIFNVNADTVASVIACALKAEKLIVATNVDGVLDHNKQVLNRLNAATIDQLKRDKVITGGMIPKVDSALAALREGVHSFHIINGMKSNSLLSEIFTEQGCGTMIVLQ